MTSTEEIMLRLGFDTSAVQRGTAVMMDQQKKAAFDYTAMWEAALDKQAVAESKANDASLAKLKVNMEAKAAVTAKFFEAQAAQYEIAQGSIGAGMLAGGATRKAERSAESGIVRGIEGAAIGGAIGGGGTMIGMGALRGAITAVRGAMIGSWNLIARGLITAVTRLGAMTSMEFLSGIPIVGAGVAGIWYNLNMRKQLQEMRGHYGTDKSLGETRERIAGRLGKEIEQLKEAGKLTAAQVVEFQTILAHGTLASFGIIQRALKPLLVQGTKLKTVPEQIREADELANRYQKQLDKKRDEKTIESDIAEKTEYIVFLRKNLAALDKDSLEYHQARARMLGYEVDLQKDQVDLAKDLKAQGFMLAGSPELAAFNAKAVRDRIKGLINAGEEESAYATMEELVGRDRMSHLNKIYGKGGRFDLGRGGGPFSDIAYDYELAQKQQIWDREHGNIGMAEKDRQRMIADREKLIGAGVANPAQLLNKIGDDTGKLLQLFDSLVKNGALIRIPSD